MMGLIFLFWWGNNKGKPDNYGDMLAPFIVKALSGKRILKVSHPMSRIYRWFFKHYLTVGSIINVAGPNSVVWGSGIINSKQNVRRARFLAVRGPRTRKRLLGIRLSSTRSLWRSCNIIAKTH
jgi:pyruvyltransferase